MLEALDSLSPEQAAHWLASLKVDWNHFPLVVEREAIMDVDPYVLAHGSRSAGAVIYKGGQLDGFATTSGPTVFVDGDLVVDGALANHGMLVVRGSLTVRFVDTRHTYLVVSGDLKAERLLGVDENYGTYVVGNATIESVVLLRNHHMGVAGNQALGSLLHDEVDSDADIQAELAKWGIDDPRG